MVPLHPPRAATVCRLSTQFSCRSPARPSSGCQFTQSHARVLLKVPCFLSDLLHLFPSLTWLQPLRWPQSYPVCLCPRALALAVVFTWNALFLEMHMTPLTGLFISEAFPVKKNSSPPNDPPPLFCFTFLQALVTISSLHTVYLGTSSQPVCPHQSDRCHEVQGRLLISIHGMNE